MPKGQAIVNGALTRLSILEQGGVPSTSDSVDALTNLNDMWDAWGIDEGLIYATMPSVFVIPANVNPITVGLSTAEIQPARIYSVAIISTVGASQIRRKLKLVDRETYYAHGDLNASAAIPEEAFINFNDPDIPDAVLVYLWPICTAPTTTLFEGIYGVAFKQWALETNYVIPSGYEDALEWALAFRLLSTFGVAVSPEIAQLVTANGSKAEARIREMNAKNRMLNQGTENSPETILRQAAPAPPKV